MKKYYSMKIQSSTYSMTKIISSKEERTQLFFEHLSFLKHEFSVFYFRFDATEKMIRLFRDHFLLEQVIIETDFFINDPGFWYNTKLNNFSLYNCKMTIAPFFLGTSV